MQQITLDHRTDEKPYSNRWSSQLSSLSGVRVELQNRKLWEQFHAETTEMIITKLGRRMFPYVQLSVSGLDKQETYYVLMEITPASDRRHKYCGNGGDDENGNKTSNRGWSFAGPAEPQPSFDRRTFCHPDSPALGEHWMQNSINFSKLKLTNNSVDCRNNVVLTSMHKYIPKIWIIRCPRRTPLANLFFHPALIISFKETEFVAVTAYQNEHITKLKIYNNPFAKGFRETGQSRCKRKYHQMDHASRPDDEENNSFSDSSESNRSASSLDDLAQKSVDKPEIKICDDCDDIKPLAKLSKLSSKTENNHESEVPSPFHRPWLDLPSRTPNVPMRPMVSSVPSTIHDLYFSYLRSPHVPFITQREWTRYYQYPFAMFQFGRL
ncbi:T-box protein 2 isoform X2 [Anoplolepis gracilipes]